MSEGSQTNRDVIFLGAGASYGAGFPVNEELTRYIIYDLIKTPRFVGTSSFGTGFWDLFQPRWKLVEQEWAASSDSLRRSKSMSVDEYCQIAAKNPKGSKEVPRLKQMLRSALMDKGDKWSGWNPYGPFIYSLFKPGSPDLDGRVSIVNFNYDGLLGKLLVDAVCNRRETSGGTLPTDEELAALAGGYHWNPATTNTVEAPKLSPLNFHHFMPHGTITALKDEKRYFDVKDIIYANEWKIPGIQNRADMFAWFYRNHYDSEPLIHFPWEKQAAAPVFEMQLETAAEAVEMAQRLHFIGISGHFLLSTTLQRLFAKLMNSSRIDGLTQKEWHIATIEKNQHAVFERILNCCVPNRNIASEIIRSGGISPSPSLPSSPLRQSRGPNLFFYDGFDDWLRSKPHRSVN